MCARAQGTQQMNRAFSWAKTVRTMHVHTRCSYAKCTVLAGLLHSVKAYMEH